MAVGVDWMTYVTGLETVDLNADGVVDINDCPYPLGTPSAKKWFYQVLDPWVRSTPPTKEAHDMYGDSVTGMYQGKPLVPGVAGPGQADFKYMVDKIRITQGLSYEAASKIAGKVKAAKYGPGPIRGLVYPKG